MNKCEWKKEKYNPCKAAYEHYIDLGKPYDPYWNNKIQRGYKVNFCPFCGADIRKPEANPLYSDFLEKFIERLSMDRNIPIEILKMKFSPDYVKWSGAERPSIDPIKESDCEHCDHPDECEECLAEFNARVTRKELSVAAKIFTDNVRLAEENDALKKLFIAEHKEKSELLNSNGLLKSREKNLLEKIKELEASNG